MAFVWLSSVLVGFVWLSLIGSVCSRNANSNWLKRVVQSNKCSTAESSICSPIIELTGKNECCSIMACGKGLLYIYIYIFFILFFFSRFSGERKRARSERGAPPDTTHARRGMHLPQSRTVWSSSLASNLPSLASKRDLIGTWSMDYDSD